MRSHLETSISRERNGPSQQEQAGAEVYREKSAACRHDPDVNSQSADPIKFCFRNANNGGLFLSIWRETVFGYCPMG